MKVLGSTPLVRAEKYSHMDTGYVTTLWGRRMWHRKWKISWLGRTALFHFLCNILCPHTVPGHIKTMKLSLPLYLARKSPERTCSAAGYCGISDRLACGDNNGGWLTQKDCLVLCSSRRSSYVTPQRNYIWKQKEKLSSSTEFGLIFSIWWDLLLSISQFLTLHGY